MNGMRLLSALISLIHQDLMLAYRRRAQLANPILFFIIVTSLFPLGLSPDSELLRSIAPGIIWIAALLAVLLSLETVFKTDTEDGVLDLLLTSPYPLAVLVLVKVLVHWLVFGLPLLLISPVLAAGLLHVPTHAIPTLLVTLVLGTPVLSLVGAIGAALTVGLAQGGILLTLLILPLYIPVLIFATSAVDAAMAGFPVSGQLAMLGALFLLALTLAPLAIAAALRISSG